MAGRLLQATCLLVVSLSLGGCVTAGAISGARAAFDGGREAEALTLLENGIEAGEVADRDRLVALLEAGMIAHVAGRIDDSIGHLSRAADLVESLDAVFVGEQASLLVVNDRVTRYSGEYAERLWIRTLQMMNFLVLGDLSGAAVEARQAVALFERYGTPLDGDLFSRALAARVLQSVGESDSAAIEFARAFDASGGAASVASMGLDAARRTGREEDVARYTEALAREVAASPVASGAGGNLLLVLASGKVPAKQAGNLFIRPDLRISFPYYPSYVLASRGAGARVLIDGREVQPAPVVTTTGQVAEASLAARASQVTARQALRVVAKQGIGAAASREDELLGALVYAVLFILEEADTRSWRTLPGELALYDVPLPAGEHSLVVENGLGDRVQIDSVQITSGDITSLVLHQRPGGWRRISPTVQPPPGSDSGPEPEPPAAPN